MFGSAGSVKVPRTEDLSADAHVAEVGVWAMFYDMLGVNPNKVGPFEFAFENYTALGYGDAVRRRETG